MAALKLVSLDEETPLDAYSRVVTEVARRLSPSAANLRVSLNAITRRIIGALMTKGRFRRAYIGIAGGEGPLPPRLAAALGDRWPES